jgi:DNA-binding transcriptional LysR family regulator
MPPTLARDGPSLKVIKLNLIITPGYDRVVRVNLNQLRVFEAVGRTGSFSRAADALGVTQPAVTVQIRRLEELCGTALFERVRRRPRLSQAGETLYRYARRIFALTDEAVEALALARDLRGGRLRLVAGRTPAACHLPPLIIAFKRRYPSVEVQLLVDSTDRVIERLLDLKDDVAVLGLMPPQAALVSEPFCDDALVLIVAPGHPWARRRRVSLAELPGESLVQREPGSSSRALVERHLAAHAVTARVAMELGSNETIKRSVEAGAGVAFMSASAVSLEVEAGRLVTVRTVEAPLVRPLFLVHHRDRSASPLVGAFLEVARALRSTGGVASATTRGPRPRRSRPAGARASRRSIAGRARS